MPAGAALAAYDRQSNLFPERLDTSFAFFQHHVSIFSRFSPENPFPQLICSLRCHMERDIFQLGEGLYLAKHQSALARTPFFRPLESEPPVENRLAPETKVFGHC